jgi:hypothetical protein
LPSLTDDEKGADMQWDHTMRVTDVAIVAATLLGPVFAVQAQMFLERRRARSSRREQIFHTLMRTRATTLSPEHVQALNAIPLEFRGVEGITDAYKAFLDHVYTPQPVPPADPKPWDERRVDLLIDILFKIGGELGYSYSAAALKRDFYSPLWHSTIENENNLIRQGLAKALSGQSGIPVDVKAFPGDPEAQAAFKAVLKAAAARIKSGEPRDSGQDRDS